MKLLTLLLLLLLRDSIEFQRVWRGPRASGGGLAADAAESRAPRKNQKPRKNAETRHRGSLVQLTPYAWCIVVQGSGSGNKCPWEGNPQTHCHSYPFSRWLTLIHAGSRWFTLVPALPPLGIRGVDGPRQCTRGDTFRNYFDFIGFFFLEFHGIIRDSVKGGGWEGGGRRWNTSMELSRWTSSSSIVFVFFFFHIFGRALFESKVLGMREGSRVRGGGLFWRGPSQAISHQSDDGMQQAPFNFLINVELMNELSNSPASVAGRYRHPPGDGERWSRAFGKKKSNNDAMKFNKINQ